jgi:hypothetical protein
MTHDSPELLKLEIGGQLARCTVQLPLQQQISLGDDNKKKQRKRVEAREESFITPFAKARRMGHPLGCIRLGKQTTQRQILFGG